MKKIYCFVFILFALPLGVLAQNKIIKGRVTDSATHKPVARASVVLQNGDQKFSGVLTDDNGEYSVNANDSATEIVFSFIGMGSDTEIISNHSIINAVLAVGSASSLNDVVVVGYGSETKAKITGAVSVISGKDLVTTKNENIVNMLAGKVPGLRMQQLSAEPGTFNTTYDIRGFGATPLIIIDGVPRSSGDFSRLDPNTIESVSVLKDASAAIYGVQGANGVILVTTKSGSKNADGKVDINYSINQSEQQFIGMPQTVTAAQYMQLFNESQRGDNFQNNFINLVPLTYSDSLIQQYENGTLPSTNWVKAISRNLAPTTQQTLSVNGGNNKLTYFFNLGYFNQGGMFKTNSLNYNRWDFQSNINATITKRLRAALLVSGYADQRNAPNGNQQEYAIFKNAEDQLPTLSPYANNNPDYLNLLPDNDNYVAYINSDLVGATNQKTYNFQGQVRLEYDIPGIKGLTAKAMYNYGLNINDNTAVNKTFNFYTYNPADSTYIPNEVGSPAYVNRAYYTSTNTDMQLSLNYQRSFANAHNVGAMLLYEEQYSYGDNFYAQRNFSLGIPYLFAGDQANQTLGGGPSNPLVRKSIVGRATYDYKGIYLAEFDFRNDASSNFSPNKQWGFFPGGSIGWRIDKEPFIQNWISPNVLTNLKLRGSYGELGSDANLNYQWVSGYNYPGTGAILGGNYINGINAQPATNDQFSWEVSKTMNVGLDLELWHGLFGGSFDYFVRKRTGLPATPLAQIPGTVGEALPQENLNSDETNGFELSLTHKNHIGQLNYSITGNISIDRTKNLFVEETRQGNPWEQYWNQQSDRDQNIWWGLIYEGQFTSYQQIYNYPVNTGGGNQGVVPGDYYYEDLNHDGVIDNKDQVPIATKDIPIVNYGMTISANWKGIDLTCLLQGATDFHVAYSELMSAPLEFNGTAFTQFWSRWHPADPNANPYDPNTVWIPGAYPYTGQPEAQTNSTLGVHNATYLRIKSLEIGYTISPQFLNRIGIKSLRVYANSYNLATFTGLKNTDPEHPGGAAPGESSIDVYTYPENRTFSLGASITF